MTITHSKHTRFFIRLLIAISVILLIGISLSLSQGPTLRSVFNPPGCQHPCWLGIQPSVTTRTQAESILTANGMTFETRDLTGNPLPGNLALRFIPPNTLPFINNASNQAGGVIYFADNIVTMIDLPVTIPIATITSEYGNPHQVIRFTDTSYWMVYPANGMLFDIITTTNIAGMVRLAIPTTIQGVMVPTNSPSNLTNCQVLGNPCPIPTATPVPPNLSNGIGLRGAYFDNVDYTGLRFYRQDAMVYFNWANASPDPALGADTFAARWTGQVEALYSQTYTFFLTHNDGARLWVNNQQIINNWTNRTTAVTSSGTINLVANTRYAIRVDYYDNTGPAELRLEWQSPSQPRQLIPATQLYGPQQQHIPFDVLIFSQTTGSGEVWVMNRDGAGRRRLTTSTQASSPRLSPTGTKIAFTVGGLNRTSLGSNLWIVNPDGTCLREITTFNGGTISGFDWSPDGTRMVYSASNPTVGGFDIYVVTVPTACTGSIPASSLIPGSSTDFEFGPIWSPNGLQIAYSREISGNREVFVMNANGTGRTQLTTLPTRDEPQSWSPDGTSILFQSTVVATPRSYQIGIIRLGLGVTCSTSQGNNLEPFWSYDRSRILFSSDRDGNNEIYSMDAYCSTQVNLTNTPTIGEGGARWAYGSRQIVYLRGGDIWVMNRDGSAPTNLSNTTTPNETSIGW
jgi:Tol biopolymer transport system component